MTEVIEPSATGRRFRLGTFKPQTSCGDDALAGLVASSRPSGSTGIAAAIGLKLFGWSRAWMVVPLVDFTLMLLPLAWRPHQYVAVPAMAILATLLLTNGGRYVAPLHLSVLDQLPTIIARVLIAVAIVATAILYTHQRMSVLTFLETACHAIVLVIIGRILTTRMLAAGRRMGIARHGTVIIGSGPVARELARILGEHPEYGLRTVGFVDDNDCSVDGFAPRLGRLADLDRAVLDNGADTLLLADGSFQERALMDSVRSLLCQHAQLIVVPRMHQFHTQTGLADHIGSIPVMRIQNPNLRGPARAVKRGFDIVVAVSALIFLSPLMITTAILVRLEGGPGVIFRQIRVGRDGRHFELWKFRSMRPADQLESETQWNIATDNRVGPVGHFLRSTSIDELPQLWNILRGDMTLVGPRPERPHFVEQFSSEFEGYTHRHRVQVGLTGFAQVSGLRGDTSIADRARYDNFYIENWSLWLDIKIIFRTFREVVFYRDR